MTIVCRFFTVAPTQRRHSIFSSPNHHICFISITNAVPSSSLCAIANQNPNTNLTPVVFQISIQASLSHRSIQREIKWKTSNCSFACAAAHDAICFRFTSCANGALAVAAMHTPHNDWHNHRSQPFIVGFSPFSAYMYLVIELVHLRLQQNFNHREIDFVIITFVLCHLLTFRSSNRFHLDLLICVRSISFYANEETLMRFPLCAAPLSGVKTHAIVLKDHSNVMSFLFTKVNVEANRATRTYTQSLIQCKVYLNSRWVKRLKIRY